MNQPDLLCFSLLVNRQNIANIIDWGQAEGVCVPQYNIGVFYPISLGNMVCACTSSKTKQLPQKTSCVADM